MKFLIQVEYSEKFLGYIPAFDFCYTVLDLINRHNWLHSFDLNDLIDYKIITYEQLLLFDAKDLDLIPIGSVEFCLTWYRLKGIENIKPLNIPSELFKYCSRYIGYTSHICQDHPPLKDYEDCKFMVKSSDNIKDKINGIYSLKNIWEEFKNLNHFMTLWKNDVVSEWRIFVFDPDNGLRYWYAKNYLGNPLIVPNEWYIKEVLFEYGIQKKKKVYTLDVMIYKDETTDILELHDFFGCGLYGFNDAILLSMYNVAHKEIMEEYKKK